MTHLLRLTGDVLLVVGWIFTGLGEAAFRYGFKLLDRTAAKGTP